MIPFEMLAIYPTSLEKHGALWGRKRHKEQLFLLLPGPFQFENFKLINLAINFLLL